MSEANKPSHDAHWNSAKATEMPVPSNREERNHVNLLIMVVHSRGALPLSQNATFHSICNMCVDYCV